MPNVVVNCITIAFDATTVNRTITTAHNKVARDALAGNTLVKVCTMAMKSNFPDKLTKSLQVLSFDPSEMKNLSNFFNFVAQWQTHLGLMGNHLQAFHMTSTFNLICVQVTIPTAVEIEDYQAKLSAFLVGSKVATAVNHVHDPGTGLLSCFNDGTSNIDRPNEPTGTSAIVDAGLNLLMAWQAVTHDQVLVLVKLMCNHITNNTYRQNLVWTFTYMMNCLDADLRQYVLSKSAYFPTPYNHTGPMVFVVVAKKMMTMTKNLAQKVINTFIALRLMHFPNKSVVDGIFTLQNLLKFLRYSETDSFAPRTTITVVYDFIKGMTVNSFHAYIQQLQDFQLKDGLVEDIFNKVQEKYDKLILADCWVSHKKKGSVFVAGKYAEAEANKQDKKLGKPDNKLNSDKKDAQGRWLVDKKGNRFYFWKALHRCVRSCSTTMCSSKM